MGVLVSQVCHTLHRPGTLGYCQSVRLRQRDTISMNKVCELIITWATFVHGHSWPLSDCHSNIVLIKSVELSVSLLRWGPWSEASFSQHASCSCCPYTSNIRRSQPMWRATSMPFLYKSLEILPVLFHYSNWSSQQSLAIDGYNPPPGCTKTPVLDRDTIHAIESLRVGQALWMKAEPCSTHIGPDEVWYHRLIHSAVNDKKQEPENIPGLRAKSNNCQHNKHLPRSNVRHQ